MKHLVTLNEYKQTNASLYVSPDMTEVRAYSYGWWRFVDTDKHGNVIFNDAKYSNSTSGHQSDVASILRRLNIRIGLRLSKTTENLTHGVEAVVESEIKHHLWDIESLKAKINTKGSHRRKNEERRAEIEGIEYRIKDLRAYLETGRLPAEDTRPCRWSYDDSQDEETSHGFEPYFLKPNGVLKRNELKAFLNTFQGWHRAPKNIKGLKEFLSLKSLEDILPVLSYQFSQDLSDMLPAIGSDDEIKLQKFVAKHKSHGVNTVLLDKMHSFLVNRQNRKTYVPREPELLPLHPSVERLKTKGIEELSVIDSVQKLRAEGRRQSHCIGGENYIRLCKQGYQALNFKGFTFLLTPDLSLRETKGRHNSMTPDSVVRELTSLLQVGS